MGVGRSYRKFGYAPETGREIAAPESKRPIRKEYSNEKGKCDQKAQKGRNGKGENCQDTVASLSEIDFSITQSRDNEICVIGGTNLRQLRDGIGLCSPGIIEPVH